jgi:hypothetical protein
MVYRTKEFRPGCDHVFPQPWLLWLKNEWAVGKWKKKVTKTPRVHFRILETGN